MKRAGGDEQNVIGMHVAVFGHHGGTFHNRQNIALHAFAGNFRAVRAFASGDFVQFVDE